MAPQTWSGKQLLEKFQIADIYWRRLLNQRRVSGPDDARMHESLELDTHAGAVWLRLLRPKAEIAVHEVGPILTHLDAAGPGASRRARDCARRGQAHPAPIASPRER